MTDNSKNNDPKQNMKHETEEEKMKREKMEQGAPTEVK